LTDAIYKKIRNAVRGTPSEKKMDSFLWRSPHGKTRTVKAVGLNERMRFLKYESGMFFAPHQDIPYVRGPEFGSRAGETSYVTVQIYLNDKGVKGGSTRFLCGTRYYDVQPKMGSVLIFDHDLLHEGSKVTGGVKYSVRTDIMYRNEDVVEGQDDHGIQRTPSIGDDTA
jgi:predicted 2-oxoglutarate/Fe(II)-dependent dioxygenase YbiX